jgi:hypothetical protein
LRINAYCSYCKCKYILTVKENPVESNEDMLKVYVEHAKNGEICLKLSSSSSSSSSSSTSSSSSSSSTSSSSSSAHSSSKSSPESNKEKK